MAETRTRKGAAIKQYRVTRTYVVTIPEKGTPEFAKIQECLIEEWGYDSLADYEYEAPANDVTTEEGLAIALTYMSDVGDGVEGTECGETNIEIEPT